MKIIEYILLLGAIQGALLSILLFTKKNNSIANKVLAFAMLALSIDIFHSAYIMFEYYKEFPHFIGVTYAFPFLYGPIFYLYAKLISSGSNHFDFRNYYHFIPFIFVVVYGFVFVYFRSSEFKFLLVKNEENANVPGLQVLNYLKPIYGIIYVFLTIKAVRVYDKKIKNSYSNIERINLNWLHNLTIGLIIVWGIVVMTYVVNEITEKEIEKNLLIYLSASVLIYAIGYFSLLQPQIFQQTAQKSEGEENLNARIKDGSSYQKSGLSEAKAEEELKKLLRIMEEEKLYLKSDITLRELASKLSISPHNLSEVLNTKLGQNFYDFVNKYRVEEVRRRLSESDSDKFSLIAIAFDSGFNSKSTFNTIFKKHTGMTPSQYRNKITRSLKI